MSSTGNKGVPWNSQGVDDIEEGSEKTPKRREVYNRSIKRPILKIC